MKHLFAMGVICFLFAACGPEVSDKTVQFETVKEMHPNYDFERRLSSCINFHCQQLPTEKRLMSEYSPDLISEVGISQADTLTDAKEKIEAFKKTRIYSSTIGNTTDPELGLLAAQISPGPDKEFAEYDIVVRAFGQHNGAKVKDWGARIRCAPVTQTTPWQKTPC